MAAGGASTILETRFGRILNGKFDPMSEFGGSLIQTTGIGPQGSYDFVGETVPPEATIVAHRLTTPLFGLGLVDAVPDDPVSPRKLPTGRLQPPHVQPCAYAQ